MKITRNFPNELHFSSHCSSAGGSDDLRGDTSAKFLRVGGTRPPQRCRLRGREAPEGPFYGGDFCQEREGGKDGRHER